MSGLLGVPHAIGREARLHSGAHVTTTCTWTDDSPHRSAFAVVNGVRLRYLDWGGSGDPLVLIHGLGDGPHLFDELAPLIADRFRVVAYVRRGHGDSEAPAAGP
jgi:alpha-beta hydrolase superfamily lysophospholipase